MRRERDTRVKQVPPGMFFLADRRCVALCPYHAGKLQGRAATGRHRAKAGAASRNSEHVRAQGKPRPLSLQSNDSTHVLLHQGGGLQCQDL